VSATSPTCPWAAQTRSSSGGGSARAPRGRSRADAESVVDPDLGPKPNPAPSQHRDSGKFEFSERTDELGAGDTLVEVEGVAAHLHGLRVLEAEAPERGMSTTVSEVIRRSWLLIEEDVVVVLRSLGLTGPTIRAMAAKWRAAAAISCVSMARVGRRGAEEATRRPPGELNSR